jgi:hypothetical protein
MILWLRYSNTFPTTTSMRFSAIDCRERMNVTRKLGETLRGSTYDHRIARRSKWTIVISADELAGPGNAKLAFLNAFFTGGDRWIALSDSLTEPVAGWIAIAIDGGDAPIEAIEGNEVLPEFTFTAVAKVAS